MSGGEALVGALAREGVSHVFGVPGAGQYEAVDPFHGRHDIHYVSCRSEQPTTYLADGYGRVTGRRRRSSCCPGLGCATRHRGWRPPMLRRHRCW